jgi:hypothetical protein
VNLRHATRFVRDAVLFPLALVSLGVTVWRMRRDLFGAIDWLASKRAQGTDDERRA